MKSEKTRSRFAVLLTLAFLGVAGTLMLRHEPWRDESQAWLIARDSPTLSAVWYQARYEGAPPLWHSALWVLTRVTHHPAAMQLFHLLLAAVLCAVLALSLPWPRMDIVLLVFGYYLLYEYAVLARNYLPGLLFLTLACRAWIQRSATWPWTCLALAAFTSVQALLASTGLAVAFLLERRPASWPERSAFLLYAAAALLSVLVTQPVADTFYPSAPRWHSPSDLPRLHLTLTGVIDAYIPWPVGGPHSWESFRLHDRSGAPAGLLWLSPVLLIGSWFALHRRRSVAWGYAVAALSLLVFFQMRFLGAARHLGFLFFIFIFCTWLAEAAGAWPRWALIARRIFLVIQVACGVVAAQTNWQLPFSLGTAAAQAIRAMNLKDPLIAVGADSSGATLAAALDTTLYFPQGDRFGSYTIWDFRRVEFLDDDEFVSRAEKVAREKNRPLVVVLNHALNEQTRTRYNLVGAGQFTGAIVPDEEFFLYHSPSSH